MPVWYPRTQSSIQYSVQYTHTPISARVRHWQTFSKHTWRITRTSTATHSVRTTKTWRITRIASRHPQRLSHVRDETRSLLRDQTCYQSFRNRSHRLTPMGPLSLENLLEAFSFRRIHMQPETLQSPRWPTFRRPIVSWGWNQTDHHPPNHAFDPLMLFLFTFALVEKHTFLVDLHDSQKRLDQLASQTLQFPSVSIRAHSFNRCLPKEFQSNTMETVCGNTQPACLWSPITQAWFFLGSMLLSQQGFSCLLSNEQANSGTTARNSPFFQPGTQLTPLERFSFFPARQISKQLQFSTAPMLLETTVLSRTQLKSLSRCVLLVQLPFQKQQYSSPSHGSSSAAAMPKLPYCFATVADHLAHPGKFSQRSC